MEAIKNPRFSEFLQREDTSMPMASITKQSYSHHIAVVLVQHINVLQFYHEVAEFLPELSTVVEHAIVV